MGAARFSCTGWEKKLIVPIRIDVGTGLDPSVLRPRGVRVR